MKRDFYEKLDASTYLSSIKHFVPGYDKLAHQLVSEITQHLENKENARVLDIGCGVGNIDQMILESDQNARIDCFDSSEQFRKKSEVNLEAYKNRTSIRALTGHERIPDATYDVAFSNLFLYNFVSNKRSQEKDEVLSKIRRSLKPGSVFLWGDLVRFFLPIQIPIMGYRATTAILKGENPVLTEAYFRKEGMFNPDSKFTIDETIDCCHRIGFKNIEMLWHDKLSTVALFYMTA